MVANAPGAGRNSRYACSRHCKTYGASERATSIRNNSASARHSTMSALPNNVRVQAAPLKPGDRVRVGAAEFVFE